MAVSKPRTRLVYFRISEEEYQHFHQLCEQGEARSISDLIRVTMQEAVMNKAASLNDLSARLSAIEGTMARVDDKLDQLQAGLTIDSHARVVSMDATGGKGKVKQ
jgi:uncharacterized protein YerC